MTIDPGGPSDKEYQLPTEPAKGENGGGDGDGRFGAGITPEATSAPSSTGSATPTPAAPRGSGSGENGNGSSDAAGGKGGVKSIEDKPRQVEVIRETATGSAQVDESSSGPFVVGTILLVLIVGVAGGWGLRKLRAGD